MEFGLHRGVNLALSLETVKEWKMGLYEAWAAVVVQSPISC
jgi:hypothetical protein